MIFRVGGSGLKDGSIRFERNIERGRVGLCMVD